MQEFLASTNFTVIFISLIGIKFLLETYLKIRNLKSIELNKNAIPERFVGVVTEEEYKKSIVYNIDRIRFQIFTALFGAVVLIIFTLGDGALDEVRPFVSLFSRPSPLLSLK